MSEAPIIKRVNPGEGKECGFKGYNIIMFKHSGFNKKMKSI